jgi:hypothetical protein
MCKYRILRCCVDSESSSYSVKTAKWIGDCFIYTTASNRLSYFVGNESYTISPFDTYVPPIFVTTSAKLILQTNVHHGLYPNA